MHLGNRFLSELPPVPPGKTDWPWTEQTPQVSETLPDGRRWPKISIITPSYNQGQFIEKAIRSVLLQGYTDLEYIIIDGGSIDDSLEMIKKYEKYLTYWVSEPDRGQSDALNKGIKMAKGEIIGYLNADDCYLPGAVKAVGLVFAVSPDVSLVHGNGQLVDLNGRVLKDIQRGELDKKSMLLRNQVFSPAAFVRGTVFDEIGGFDDNLHLSMDYDMWIRIAMRFKTKHVPVRLTAMTLYAQTKSVLKSFDMALELVKVKLNYLNISETVKLLGNDYSKIKQFCFWELGWFNYQSLNLKEARKWLIQSILIRPWDAYSVKAFFVLLLSLLGKSVSKNIVWSFHSFLNPIAISLRNLSRYIRGKTCLVLAAIFFSKAIPTMLDLNPEEIYEWVNIIC